MAAIGRYDALLCDLDGVLRIWNAAALAEAYGADVAAAAVDQMAGLSRCGGCPRARDRSGIRAGGFPVVLVTNQSDRLGRDLAALGLTDAFDAVVNSAVVGVAKPEVEIYHLAAEAADRPPYRCVFVDDTLANVDAARAVGMMALHYRGLEVLQAAADLMHAQPLP